VWAVGRVASPADTVPLAPAAADYRANQPTGLCRQNRPKDGAGRCQQRYQSDFMMSRRSRIIFALM
jgi:hypothetical protein